MTFTKTIHSITALPVYCIIYICIVSPNRNARSSNSFVYCHPFIMKATLLLKRVSASPRYQNEHVGSFYFTLVTAYRRSLAAE